MAWAALLGRVGVELTRALAIALGAPGRPLRRRVRGRAALVRQAHPLCRARDRPARTPRASGRTPTGASSPSCSRTTPAACRPVRRARASGSTSRPLDGALVINVGEMLEVATDGYLVATEHRVLPCAPGATRQSIGIFWSPRLDATLDALPLPPRARRRGPRRLTPRAQRAAPPLRRQRPQGLAPVAPRGGRPAPPRPRRRGLSCARATPAAVLRRPLAPRRPLRRPARPHRVHAGHAVADRPRPPGGRLRGSGGHGADDRDRRRDAAARAAGVRGRARVADGGRRTGRPSWWSSPWSAWCSAS